MNSPRSFDSTEEELRAVCIGTGVGHGEDTRASVLLLEILIRKLLAVDRLAASAIAAREIAALCK